MIRFEARLHQPAGNGEKADWLFLRLPKAASDELPSRAMVSVEGQFAGVPFQATLEPDGEGGHWLRVEPDLRAAAGAARGEVVRLAIAPMDHEPEPVVPEDFQLALNAAGARAQEVWREITPLARRDWIQWVTSPKKLETRQKRILTGCDMLSNGKRRPCCFDRSGMYSKSLSCPLPAPDED